MGKGMEKGRKAGREKREGGKEEKEGGREVGREREKAHK